MQVGVPVINELLDQEIKLVVVVGVFSLEMTLEILVLGVGATGIDTFAEAIVGNGGVFLLVPCTHVTDHARQALGVFSHCQIVDIAGGLLGGCNGCQLCHNFLPSVFDWK